MTVHTNANQLRTPLKPPAYHPSITCPSRNQRLRGVHFCGWPPSALPGRLQPACPLPTPCLCQPCLHNAVKNNATPLHFGTICDGGLNKGVDERQTQCGANERRRRTVRPACNVALLLQHSHLQPVRAGQYIAPIATDHNVGFARCRLRKSSVGADGSRDGKPQRFCLATSSANSDR